MSSGATVFVVDDDPGALRSMRWLLESDGLAVETYLSGEEFLKAYDPNRPGCLLLDLRMRGMDGLELQKRIASRGPHPPIIFVSGHGDVAKCAEAMKTGAVDFLEKPADDAKILAAVHLALEKDRRRRSVEATHPEIAARIARLTPRERETLRFMLEGDATKRIASQLDVGNQTAAKHRARVLSKMEVGSEAELVRLLKDYPLAE
jgi:two-component system, LuxR family, response regulator FixJ